ncbi:MULTISPECIES: ParB N-terminal domain-containing protein [unclassified Microbacterium]|uniref:ParB N-terminal domain-containing protein n=1 Tax=Microbacterium TaxID=33882 RepID=UPI00214A90C7|nr:MULTISPECIES: ParB N-terminal domain-containing protein [unclassified Microbacterium]MCR2812884.1 ParB N-terminal domain-containing protein [Microbacterium sp. zg.Y1084]MCR2816577.1 ParB N-terminal domain-containing protein [Microbacterium sp. zg.Y843]
MTDAVSVAEDIRRLPVQSLQLDPQNPRLPEDMLGKTQPELLAWLDNEETLDELAASMLANGFFAHEPLVVLAEENGLHTVVEGNRRFATISILLQTPAAEEADLEFEFESRPSDAQLAALREVPCLVVSSAEEVRKFLGFRHIGGLKTWSPEAKARYLEDEIKRAVAQASQTPFRDVGRRVGSNATGVRNSYIALRVLRTARDDLGLQQLASYVLRNRFGVWTRLLNSAEVREYIGFGDPVDYDAIEAASREIRDEQLQRVLEDLQPRKGSTRAVLNDSRDATNYGRVLANDAAREALIKYGDLNLAYQVVDRASLADRLETTRNSLELIVNGIDSYLVTDVVVSRAEALASTARTLMLTVKDRREPEED